MQMLKIVVPANKDLWDEANNKFLSLKKEVSLTLEHSLVSVAKWESKWKRPYLSNEKMTNEQVIDYIRCMTISQNIDDLVYYCLSEQNLKDIEEYINDPMTATTFSNRMTAQQTAKNEVMTAELIYFYMLANNVPVEFQKWHLNKLLTLLKVCAIKNTPPKKMSRRETMANYAAINKANRAKFHTKG